MNQFLDRNLGINSVNRIDELASYRRFMREVLSISFNSLGLVQKVEECPLEILFRSYLENFEDENSPTWRAKAYDFKAFISYLAIEKNLYPSLKQLTKGRVDGFRDFRIESGEAYSTVNRRLATLKHFARELERRLPSFHDDIQHVSCFQISRVRSKALSDSERGKILNSGPVGSNAFIQLRNHCMIRLLDATGVRADEILNVKIRHLDQQWLKGIRAKGKKIRDVYLPSSTNEILESYIEARLLEINKRFAGHLYLKDSEKGQFPLFITFYKASLDKPESFQMSYENLRSIVDQYAQNSGVADLHAHRFRHSLITRMDQAGVRTSAIMQTAGHTDIRTTQGYMTASEDELVNAAELVNKKVGK